jgi:tripartite-type tricarboxylate transporter receptor subunit TctC
MMRNPHCPTRRALIAAAAAWPLLAHGQADTFPSRPIKLIVPFAPGNSTDLIARAMAEGLRKELNQTFTVENKTGANAMIAAQFVTTQPADGYTLFFASDSALVLNPLLYKNPGYAPERDFAPLALVADVPLVMTVNHQVPAKNVAEFVAYAKAHPNKLNFGSTGTGGAFHLAGELFKQLAGIEMTHVPYKGGAPATQAMLAGEIQVLFGVVGSSLPHIKAGKLRPLAMATKQRVAVLPDVPTIAESGYPDFESTVRYGLVVAKATPAPVMARLSDAVNKVLSDPAFRSHWGEQGYVVPASHPPSQYAAVLERDRKTWGALIRARGIALD